MIAVEGIKHFLAREMIIVAGEMKDWASATNLPRWFRNACEEDAQTFGENVEDMLIDRMIQRRGLDPYWEDVAYEFEQTFPEGLRRDQLNLPPIQQPS